MKSEQRKAIVVQIGEVQPATDALIGSFAESVAKVRNHEHPSWEDLYCMNLTSYMGERVAPVLRRLLNAENELADLIQQRDRIANDTLTTIADTAEAYPGELAMLRGLIGVLRVTATHGGMDEVRRLLAEHVTDEQAAYAELAEVKP
jgi:hypothetical protein